MRVIEIVDELDNDSRGRSIKDKIILPRKYGLEGVVCKEKISDYELVDNQLKMLISTIFHELWHVTTWEKYEKMYQYVLDETSEDIYLVFAYMYCGRFSAGALWGAEQGKNMVEQGEDFCYNGQRNPIVK